MYGLKSQSIRNESITKSENGNKHEESCCVCKFDWKRGVTTDKNNTKYIVKLDKSCGHQFCYYDLRGVIRVALQEPKWPVCFECKSEIHSDRISKIINGEESNEKQFMLLNLKKAGLD